MMAQELVDIEPGNWFVVKRRFSIDAHEAKRVTPQKVFFESGYRNRDSQCFRSDVVYAGDKNTAERLREQLTSSRAQYDDDQRNASKRHADRSATFIAKARGQ